MAFVNGWTKEKVREQVRKYNNGTRALTQDKLDDLVCTYQAPDGNRCFVGAFFPDDSPALKTNGPGYLIAAEYGLNSCLPLTSDALVAFQHSHDYAEGGDTYAALDRFLATLDDEGNLKEV